MELSDSLSPSGSTTLYLPTPNDSAVYLLPPGRHVLGRDQTLIFGAGARVGADHGAAELVLEGQLVAAADAWLFETGSEASPLTVRCLSGSADRVYPQWWGAGSDPATSDADAIEQMLRSIEESGVDTVAFGSTSPYTIDRTVTLLRGKRYEGAGAIFQPRDDVDNADVDPLMTLSSVAAGRTEVTGFRLRGGGRPITLLSITPNLDDMTLTWLTSLDFSRTSSVTAALPASPVPTSITDIGRAGSVLPTTLTPIGADPPEAFSLRLQPPTLHLPTIDPRSVVVERCELRDAATGVAYIGSLDLRLADCLVEACDVGLDLDVVSGRLRAEGVGVRPSGSKATEVRLRVRQGVLEMDAVTLAGRLVAEVKAGELGLRRSRFGFASFGPSQESPDTPAVSRGRIAVSDCIFDGAERVETPSGSLLAGVHIHFPHEVVVQRSVLRSVQAQAGEVGVVVDWTGQRVGSVVFEGCLWEGGDKNATVVDAVALHNIDLRSASELALSSNRLVVRSSTFGPPFSYALCMEGGNAELDGCRIATLRVLWVRQRASAGQQVFTLRGPAFRWPGVPGGYARFEQVSGERLSLILVNEDVLLDAEAAGIEVARVSPETLAAITTVGRRVIEGTEASPSSTVCGLVGDIYRVRPIGQSPDARRRAHVTVSSDLVCVKTGIGSFAIWKPYCRTALEAP